MSADLVFIAFEGVVFIAIADLLRIAWAWRKSEPSRIGHLGERHNGH